jgi:hypothetical protein
VLDHGRRRVLAVERSPALPDLGYRPRDAETVAALPATVYSLRSVEETEGILAQAGFAAIRSTAHSIGESRLACSEARCPELIT